MRNVAAFVPNLFWKVADWPQIDALVFPRSLLIAAPEGGDKKPLSNDQARKTFEWTRAVYQTGGGADDFSVTTGLRSSPDSIASWLNQENTAEKIALRPQTTN